MDKDKKATLEARHSEKCIVKQLNNLLNYLTPLILDSNLAFVNYFNSEKMSFFTRIL